MGMYTEFHFNVRLKDDTPKDVLEVLTLMLGGDVEPPMLPDHPLFKTPRWHYMLVSDSEYFDSQSRSELSQDFSITCRPRIYLSVRTNLKNYNEEIQKFIDWIRPHLASTDPRDLLGYYRYEESREPTLLYPEDYHARSRKTQHGRRSLE